MLVFSPNPPCIFWGFIIDGFGVVFMQSVDCRGEKAQAYRAQDWTG